MYGWRARLGVLLPSVIIVTEPEFSLMTPEGVSCHYHRFAMPGNDPNKDAVSILKMAEEFGATHTVNITKLNPVDVIRDITCGGVDFSLECVGNPKVLRQAVDVLPRCGVCGILGVVAPGTEVSLDMDLLMNGRTIKGIIEGDAIPDLFIPKLVELYKHGRLPFDKLITFYPFDEINRAVEDMERRRVIKPVLRQ